MEKTTGSWRNENFSTVFPPFHRWSVAGPKTLVDCQVLKLLVVRELPRNQSKLWHIFCYYKTAAKTAASTFFESNERQWSNLDQHSGARSRKIGVLIFSELTPIETTREFSFAPLIPTLASRKNE